MEVEDWDLKLLTRSAILKLESGFLFCQLEVRTAMSQGCQSEGSRQRGTSTGLTKVLARWESQFGSSKSSSFRMLIEFEGAAGADRKEGKMLIP